MSNFRNTTTFPHNGGVIRNPIGRLMRGAPYPTHRVDSNPPQGPIVSAESGRAPSLSLRTGGLNNAHSNPALRSQRLLGQQAVRTNASSPPRLTSLSPPPLTQPSKRVTNAPSQGSTISLAPPPHSGTLPRPPLLPSTRTNTQRLLSPPPLLSLQDAQKQHHSRQTQLQPQQQQQQQQQTAPRLAPPQSTPRNLLPLSNISSRALSLIKPSQFQQQHHQQNTHSGYLLPPPLPHDASLHLDEYNYYYDESDHAAHQAYPVPPQIPLSTPLSAQSRKQQLNPPHLQQPIEHLDLPVRQSYLESTHYDPGQHSHSLSAPSLMNGLLNRQPMQPPPLQSPSQHSLPRPPPLSSPQQQQHQQQQPLANHHHQSPSHQPYHPKPSSSVSPEVAWAGLSPAEKHEAWALYYASIGQDG